jgi:hypothetical protein
MVQGVANAKVSMAAVGMQPLATAVQEKAQGELWGLGPKGLPNTFPVSLLQ